MSSFGRVCTLRRGKGYPIILHKEAFIAEVDGIKVASLPTEEIRHEMQAIN